jgi:hypothetical protein
MLLWNFEAVEADRLSIAFLGKVGSRGDVVNRNPKKSKF